MASLAFPDRWWSWAKSEDVASAKPALVCRTFCRNHGGWQIDRNAGGLFCGKGEWTLSFGWTRRQALPGGRVSWNSGEHLGSRRVRRILFGSTRLQGFSEDFRKDHIRYRVLVCKSGRFKDECDFCSPCQSFSEFRRSLGRSRELLCKSGSSEDEQDLCSPRHSFSEARKLGVARAFSTFPVAKPSADETSKLVKWRLEDDILELKGVQMQLKACVNLQQKVELLKSMTRVQAVFGGIGRPGIYVSPAVEIASRLLNEHEFYVLMCLVASGQEHVLDWPLVLRDGDGAQEGSKLKFPSGNRISVLKEVFMRLGQMIERWEGPPETTLQYLKSEEDFDSDACGGYCMETEWRILEALRALVSMLTGLEKMYDSIGGIVGYQLRALELIRDSETEKSSADFKSNGCTLSSWAPQAHFSVPGGPDLSKDKAYAMQAASWGIEGLPGMGEIYPLGGAGDRLGLVDELSGECLPVAMLPYCGRTLLEGHIRDLQAREFLYFKVFGTQQITPVAIMTSAAKKNDERVHALCESLSWFGRGKGNFLLFKQPLVPTVAVADGKWLVSHPLHVIAKPGGHGVIWKLCNDEGVFKWFYSKGRKAAIVRQISNPVAATDCTLLALSGIGLKHEKKLGFAACERNVGAAEGVNVLMERHLGDGSREYAVTCIEYTELNKLGIVDVPVTQGSMQAQYPANTNVLYVDLPAVEQVASSQTATLPGMIMNLKKPLDYVDRHGNRQSVRAGRLECTMQNVADSLTTKRFSRLSSSYNLGELDTYLIYNQRRKVTSSAKRRRKQGDYTLHQTPEGSFLDVIRNASELLTHCGVQLPIMEGNHCYIDFGPPFLVLMHPSLGPLWHVIHQKIQGGSLGSGSELQLEIAELAWTDVQIDGSMLIKATNIMGSMEVDHIKEEPILQYGVRCGRCRLSHVKVKNKGVDWGCANNVYWKNKVERLEALEIILEEDAEFEATNVTILGAQKFFVPKGHMMKVTSAPTGEMVCALHALPSTTSQGNGSWNWNYKLCEDGTVELRMVFPSEGI